MALKIEWDKYEVALLIDACEQVLYKGRQKREVVSNLSHALRTRAQLSGMEIDDIFRNENGIFLQMTKMSYVLTDGRIGLPGASKLYVEVAALRKSNPDEYSKLLKAAKKQLGEKEPEVETNNKEDFSQWLPSHLPRAYTVDVIVHALEEGSDYCRSHGISREDFWAISEKSKFTAITTKLLSMRFYRLIHKTTATVLDKAVPLYSEFLKTRMSPTTNVDNKTTSDMPVPCQESFEKDTESLIELFFSLGDSVEMQREKLDIITGILKKRYSTTPAKTWKEIIDNNKDLPVHYINPLAQKVEQQTAFQHLIANGIIQKPTDAMNEEEKREAKRENLERITQILFTRITNKPIFSLKQLIEQNPDVPVTSINAWTKDLYGLTASEYLLDKGILQAAPEKTEEVSVAVNDVFFGWIFGFGGKVKITAPENVKEKYAEMVRNAANAL